MDHLGTSFTLKRDRSNLRQHEESSHCKGITWYPFRMAEDLIFEVTQTRPLTFYKSFSLRS